MPFTDGLIHQAQSATERDFMPLFVMEHVSSNDAPGFSFFRDIDSGLNMEQNISNKFTSFLFEVSLTTNVGKLQRFDLNLC